MVVVVADVDTVVVFMTSRGTHGPWLLFRADGAACRHVVDAGVSFRWRWTDRRSGAWTKLRRDVRSTSNGASVWSVDSYRIGASHAEGVERLRNGFGVLLNYAISAAYRWR